PVKPERYRRLGLRETSRASRRRSGRPAATVARRCSKRLLSIQKFPGENLRTIGERVRELHVAALFRISAGVDEAPNVGDDSALDTVQLPSVELVQDLLHFLATGLRLILKFL